MVIERKEPGLPAFVGFETGLGLIPTDVYDPILATLGVVMLKNLMLVKGATLPYLSAGFTTQANIDTITAGNPTTIKLTGDHGIPLGETFPVVLAGINQTGGAALDINGAYPTTGVARATAHAANADEFTIPVDTTARTYESGTARWTREFFYTEAARLNVEGIRAHRSYLNPLTVVGDGSALDGKGSFAMQIIPKVDTGASGLPPAASPLHPPYNAHVSRGATVTADNATVYQTLYAVPSGTYFKIERIGLMLGGTTDIAVGVADDDVGTGFVPIMQTRAGDLFPKVWRIVPAGKYILVRNTKAGAGAAIGAGYVEGEHLRRFDGMHVEDSSVLSADNTTTYAELLDLPAGSLFKMQRFALSVGDTTLVALGQADDAAGLNWIPFHETADVLLEGTCEHIILGPRKILAKNTKTGAGAAEGSIWMCGAWHQLA
jgi:hypothetical protein